MAKQENDYAWIGWTIAIIIGAIFIYWLINNNASSDDSSSAWNCVDATSYNQNAYDDNRCTDGNETRYVSDSEAESLDSSYSPGKAGASYYNNR